MIKHHVGFSVEKNAYQDNGDGYISFPKGLVITDNSVQRNGTAYDISTLNLSDYQGQVTADHKSTIDTIIGRVNNVYKKGNKVIVDGIRFAVKENAYARLAYDLMKGGFLTDFSTETYGPSADETGVFKNSSLVGLSAVVVGNNKNAHTKIGELVANSIQESKKNGLSTVDLENEFIVNDIVDNNKDNINKKEEKMEEEKKVVETDAVEAVETENKEESKTLNSILDVVESLQHKIDSIEQNSFDKLAEEPKFKKVEDKNMVTGKSLDSLSYKERHAKQINAAWDTLIRKDMSASKELNAINEVNLNELKKDGIVENSMSISDFGNFVISPELLKDIEGQRNDYTPLIQATTWRETLSTQMAWLSREGDINMQEVDYLGTTTNGGLKPISEYSAEIKTSNLTELAAVTPVCNAATRFLAVDLLGDVAAGYRNDYDRKRAQLIIARLQQAVNATGNTVIFNTAAAKATNPLLSILDAYRKIANTTPNGTFVMNNSSYAEILGAALSAGVQGPLSTIFTDGEIPRLFGRPFIVVSDDLMPTLNTAGTKSFSIDGATVSITAGMFYGDLSKFTGRTSGGLQYDLSTDAAYEVDSVVRSAFQRNELVLRGSFFRGGQVIDKTKVAAILAPGVS